MENIKRLERKFPILKKHTGILYAWLCCNMKKDKIYYYTKVNSLYVDTKDLVAYNESINGLYRKCKLRLRWYGDTYDNELIRLYIEIKTKNGYISEKFRHYIDISSDELRIENLNKSILKNKAIIDKLSSLNFDYKNSKLYPSLLINYERFRFYDSINGNFFTLDKNISSKIMNVFNKYSSGKIFLDYSILEIKGSQLELPEIYQSLTEMKLS